MAPATWNAIWTYILSDMISAALFTSLRPLGLSLLDVEENKQGHNREDTEAN